MISDNHSCRPLPSAKSNCRYSVGVNFESDISYAAHITIGDNIWLEESIFRLWLTTYATVNRQAPASHSRLRIEQDLWHLGTLEPFLVTCLPCYHVKVIISFKDGGTEDVFNGRETRIARRTCPPTIWSVAQRKLDQLDSAAHLRDLRAPPGNRLEGLSGDRSGQHSIRINDRYRICFVWTDAGPVAVEITDYH